MNKFIRFESLHGLILNENDLCALFITLQTLKDVLFRASNSEILYFCNIETSERVDSMMMRVVEKMFFVYDVLLCEEESMKLWNRLRENMDLERFSESKKEKIEILRSKCYVDDEKTEIRSYYVFVLEESIGKELFSRYHNERFAIKEEMTKESFMNEYKSYIEECHELLHLFRSVLKTIEDIISKNENEKEAFVVKKCPKIYRGCIIKMLEMKEKFKEINDFRKFSYYFPFRLTVYVLKFYGMKKISWVEEYSVLDFYGYFSLDKSRKIFQIFSSMYAFFDEYNDFTIEDSSRLSKIGTTIPIGINVVCFSDIKDKAMCKKLNNKKIRPSILIFRGGGDLSSKFHCEKFCENVSAIGFRKFDRDKVEWLSQFANVRKLYIRGVSVPVIDTKCFINLDKLEVLTDDSKGINKGWHFCQFPNLKKLRLQISECLTLKQIRELSMGCKLIESLRLVHDFAINILEDELLDVPNLHLFFVKGVKIKDISFYGITCNTWTELKKEERCLLSYSRIHVEVITDFFFRYICECCEDTLSNFSFSYEDSVVPSSLRGLTRMKALKKLFINGGYFEKNSLLLESSCKSIEELNVNQHKPTLSVEGIISLKNPQEFVSLEVIYLEGYYSEDVEEYSNVGVNDRLIEMIVQFPNLKDVTIAGLSKECEKWYLLFGIRSLTKLDIYFCKDSKLLEGYSFSKSSSEWTEKDKQFVKYFNMGENIENLSLGGKNFPWFLFFQIIEKCKKLQELFLEIGALGNYEIYVYVLENIVSFPRIRRIDFPEKINIFLKKRLELEDKGYDNVRYRKNNYYDHIVHSNDFICVRKDGLRVVENEGISSTVSKLSRIVNESIHRSSRKVKKNFGNELGEPSTIDVQLLPSRIRVKIIYEFCEISAISKRLKVKDLYGFFIHDSKRSPFQLFGCVVATSVSFLPTNIGLNKLLSLRVTISRGGRGREVLNDNFFGQPDILDVYKVTLWERNFESFENLRIADFCDCQISNNFYEKFLQITCTKLEKLALSRDCDVDNTVFDLFIEYTKKWRCMDYLVVYYFEDEVDVNLISELRELCKSMSNFELKHIK